VIQVPHPERYPEQLIDFLVSNANLWEGALILETADNAAVCLLKSKELLSRYNKVVAPDWDIS
jgi:hypothetical protein